MKWLQFGVELGGVGLLALAAWWTFAPAGVAIAGAYLVYLSWDGGGDGDGS